MGGIGIWQLIIILVIILLIFGTKKLRNLGSDLGGALKGFKNAMDEGKENEGGDESSKSNGKPRLPEEEQGNTYNVKAEKVEDEEKEKS